MDEMLLLPAIAAYAQPSSCHDTWFKTVFAQFLQENFCESGAQATKAV